MHIKTGGWRRSYGQKEVVNKRRDRSHFSLQALLGCVSVCVCVRDRKCFLPRGVSLEISVRMNLLSIVYSGLFREMRDSSVSRSALGGRRGCDSLQYLTQHLHNAFRPDRERERAGGGEEDAGEGATGEDKKMEEQHLLPSERNPSTIQIKKEQIGRKA